VFPVRYVQNSYIFVPYGSLCSWFSSILEQMLSWYIEFHVALCASHAALPLVTSKFRPNVTLPMSVQFSQQCSPSGVILNK
jgi:hypothetical protein